MKRSNRAEYHKMHYKKHPNYQKEYRKKHPEKYKAYLEKQRLRKAKEREERVIALLGERNWRKIKVEGKKGSYYAVDDGHIYTESGKEIGSVHPSGYVYSTLGYIHKIIWEAFKGKIPKGYQIDHINTIRNDNRLENLRIVTPKENCNNPLTIEHYKQHSKTLDYAYITHLKAENH